MKGLSLVDYSQGLPTPSLGLLAALGEIKPMSLVQLKASEVERVRKWVEGPGPIGRAMGFMKSAFHQIAEGRAEPAAKLVISAAVLAGFGYKQDPQLASRIIETARRVVHHALAAKTGAAAGLGFWFLPTASKEQAIEASMRLARNIAPSTMTGKPKLRPIQALPAEYEGQPGIVFPDPASIAAAKGILARRGIPTAGPGIFVSPEEEAAAAMTFAEEWPEFLKSTIRLYTETLKRAEEAAATAATAVAGLTDLFAPYPYPQLDSKGTMWALLGSMGMGPMEMTLIQWLGEEERNLLKSRKLGDEARAKEHEKMIYWINAEIRKIREEEERGGEWRLINPWTGEPA